MLEPFIYREEVGNFAFTLENFSSASHLWRAHFHREDEIGWTKILGESLSWDEFDVIIKQARMKMNHWFLEECDQEAWEIYLTRDKLDMPSPTRTNENYLRYRQEQW